MGSNPEPPEHKTGGTAITFKMYRTRILLEHVYRTGQLYTEKFDTN
jgi:hypothetical protein